MVGMVLARAATSMLPNSTTQLALSGYSILGQGLAEVRIKSVKLDASLGLLEDPSSVANDFEIHVENAFDKGVKCGENQNEEGWQSRLASQVYYARLRLLGQRCTTGRDCQIRL